MIKLVPASLKELTRSERLMFTNLGRESLESEIRRVVAGTAVAVVAVTVVSLFAVVVVGAAEADTVAL